jgi:excisionase family DNA binding protein
MPSLFKKRGLSYRTPEGRKCKKHEAVTADASGKEVLRSGFRRKKEKSKNWYGKFTDASGRVHCVPLCPDKAASEQMLSKLIADAAMGKLGLVDPFAEHRRRPLTEHLADYRKILEAKGDTPGHIELTVSRVQALLDGVGAAVVDDLDIARVSEWLTAKRRPRDVSTDLPPGKTEFTPREVAALLGISGAAVRKAVKHRRLPATGHGKKRRYPRATVAALLDRTTQGAAPETVNHYVRAIRSFLRWMVKVGRIPANPLATLELLNAKEEVRHGRRALTADELIRLLGVTRDSRRSFRGLSGEDRFHLYATACGTGYRARGLASLTRESFALDERLPVVTIAVRRNKSRKPKVQPLPLDVAELLRGYLKGRTPGQPLWGGTWAEDHRGAEMLRGDLEAAGIPYVVAGPDGPLHADFHSLRHSYLTLGGQAGIDLRTLQVLAGHSTPVLTTRYDHRELAVLAAAVEKLPRFLPKRPEPEETQLKAADIDDPAACTRLARTPDVSGQDPSSPVSGQCTAGATHETTQPPVLQGVGHRQT